VTSFFFQFGGVSPHSIIAIPASTILVADQRMAVLFVITLNNGYFYVGSAPTQAAAKDQIKWHQAGHGNEWTRRHRPIKGSIQEIARLETVDAEHITDWVDTRVVALAAMVGIDKVRGSGQFGSTKLPHDKAQLLRNAVASSRGVCVHCESPFHTRSQCRAKNRAIIVD
jgi:hypothetical protein